MAAATGAMQPYPKTPILDKNMALIVLVVNLFFPGIGTIVAGIVGNQPQIGKGILQLILSIILVGWVWALVTSIQCLQNATWQERKGGTPKPAA